MTKLETLKKALDVINGANSHHLLTDKKRVVEIHREVVNKAMIISGSDMSCLDLCGRRVRTFKLFERNYNQATHVLSLAIKKAEKVEKTHEEAIKLNETFDAVPSWILTEMKDKVFYAESNSELKAANDIFVRIKLSHWAGDPSFCLISESETPVVLCVGNTEMNNLVGWDRFNDWYGGVSPINISQFLEQHGLDLDFKPIKQEVSKRFISWLVDSIGVTISVKLDPDKAAKYKEDKTGELIVECDESGKPFLSDNDRAREVFGLYSSIKNNGHLPNERLETESLNNENFVIHKDECKLTPEQVAKDFAKVQELRDKQNFFSGLYVAMQTIRGYGEPTIAQEVLEGLGGDCTAFRDYGLSEGGTDGETAQWLIDHGFLEPVKHTFSAVKIGYDEMPEFEFYLLDSKGKTRISIENAAYEINKGFYELLGFRPLNVVYVENVEFPHLEDYRIDHTEDNDSEFNCESLTLESGDQWWFDSNRMMLIKRENV